MMLRARSPFIAALVLVTPVVLLTGVAHGQIPVQIINNSPGPETAKVDVYVDGTKVADDLAFKEATAFVDGGGIPQIIVGPTSTVVVADSASTDASSPLASESLLLTMGVPALIEVIGLVNPVTNPDGRSTALDIIVFEGYEPAAPQPNLLRLMAVHASPDGGTVDLLAYKPGSGLPAVTLFDSLAYGDMQPYITITPDSVQLYVVETGTTNVIKSFSASFGLVTGAGVVGNAVDFIGNLGLLGVVASENPANPGRAITFELNEIAATDVGNPPSARLGASLGQNYPNPFNPRTTIPVRVDMPQRVRLSVFDSRGRRVRTLLDRELQSGDYFIPFEALGLASGAYHYELRTANGTQRRTMVLLK